MKPALLVAIMLGYAAVTNPAIARDESANNPADARIGRPLVGPGVSPSRNEVRVEQHGDRFVVHAQSEVDADKATIWSTLSDYDHLAQFIPDISSSRTISRNGAEAVVEQKGSASIGPMHRTFTLRFTVREQLAESISLSGAGDDFELFDARYDIVSLTPHRSRIVYEATIVPRLPVPSFLSLLALRSMISSQCRAVIQEVLRRQTT
jgi:carbon monoxide dehydrogenase subunit G